MNESVLIYDGECPVCANYIAFAKLRERVRGLRIVSAREDDPAVREAWKFGINLNDEMALFLHGKWFVGAEAILELARLGEPSHVDRFLLTYLGAKHGRGFRYRILVWCRKLLLKVLGRSEIQPPSST